MADKYAADREMLESLLDISSTRVQQNTKVVTPDDYKGQEIMLHISTNTNIRKFIPQISTNGALSENRDIGRIHVAATILGCLIGYARAEADYSNKSTGKEEDNGFKGGWKIYALPFKAALLPNTKMVYDAKASDEVWLVSYSPETREYVPETAGRFFMQSIRYETRTGKMPFATVTYYMEITREEGLYFGDKVLLEKGYWRIEGPEQRHVTSYKADGEFTYTKISKDEYSSVKKASADLLSHSDTPVPGTRPAFLNWR